MRVITFHGISFFEEYDVTKGIIAYYFNHVLYFYVKELGTEVKVLKNVYISDLKKFIMVMELR